MNKTAGKESSASRANRLSFSRRMTGSVSALAALALLSAPTGCMVGPDFERPPTMVPANWTGPGPSIPGGRETAAEEDLSRWWTAFGDPALTLLVERAVRSNLDLKLAEARIRQARAVVGVSSSELGPSLDASGSYRRARSPGSSNSNAFRAEEGSITNQYLVGFDASWELDIFGGLRRGIEASKADLQAAVESRRDVLVTLSAETALQYIGLRSFQQRIEVGRRNLRVQEHAADLTRQRFQHGFVSRLDVANAEAQAATTAAQIPFLESSARQAVYRLGVLLGTAPADLVGELSPASIAPLSVPAIPIGTPSELLRRRPDIRRAEAQIHSATARIGVAAADMFPRFVIFGAGGRQANSLDLLGNSTSLFWSLGPTISLPIFESGRLRSAVEVQKALQEQSIISYKETVLTALEEVESALTASQKEQERRKALTDAVEASRTAVDLADKLYAEGVTDFLNVLQAQRSLYASEDSLVQSTYAVLEDLVSLYKALGGGWPAPTETSEKGRL